MTLFIDGTNGIRNTNNLFFVEKTAKNGTRSFKLVSLRCPCIEKIKCRLYNHFSNEKRALIDHAKTLNWLSIAANELVSPEKNLNSLLTLESLRTRAQALPNIETPSHRRNRLMTKFKRAVAVAKVIGKGTLKIIKQGYSPLRLHSSYIDELTTNRIHYVNEHEQHLWKISIEAGRVFRKNDIYQTAANKEAFKSPLDGFIISPEKVIYSGPIEPKKFHHSSFLAGGSVIFAGELRTDALGRVTHLTNRSGHYRPQREQFLKTLGLFKAWNIDLSEVQLTEYSESSPKLLHVFNSAERYLQSNGCGAPDEVIGVN